MKLNKEILCFREARVRIPPAEDNSILDFNDVFSNQNFFKNSFFYKISHSGCISFNINRKSTLGLKSFIVRDPLRGQTGLTRVEIFNCT